VAANKITDLCFSQPDCKWLISSSLDKSLKVFDILTGSLIDWIQFKNAPMSIDFSLSGEFLATAHVGSKAVFLWSSKAFFQNVVIQKVPTKPVMIDLPALASSEKVKQSHKDFYLQDKLDAAEAEKNKEEITQTLIEAKFAKTDAQKQGVEAAQ